jgi:Ca2+-binding RTX toxin-like protein
MRRAWIATGALTLLLTAPAAARAVTVEIEKQPVVAVVVTAAPGERNDIVLTIGHSGWHVDDPNPMVAGPGCFSDVDNTVSCPDPGNSVRAVRVAAGDGDDSIWSGFGDEVFTFLSGGAGDDLLESAGTSPTQFTGGSGDDELRGGPGRDVFLEDRSPNGSDLIAGDRFSGTEPPGRHRDVVSYRGRTRGVSVDLDGNRDDGAPGERDQVAPDVESILGGRGPDRLVGNARSNFIRGGAGADHLVGGGGRDELYGGPGDDVIRSRDGRREPVLCGAGADSVFADRLEALTLGCERRLRA